MCLAMPKLEQIPSISIQEFRQRIKAVRQAMQRKEMDAILVFGAGGTSTGNVRYLSNWYSRSIYDQSLLILPDGSDPILFIRLKPYRAKQVSWIEDIRQSGRSGPSELIKDVVKTLERLGVTDGRLGVVGSFHETWRGIVEPKLRKQLVKAKFADADEILSLERQEKSSNEIEIMKMASLLIDSAFQTLRTNLILGKTDFEIIAECEYIARKSGAEDMLNLIGISVDGEFIPPISLSHPIGTRFKNRHVVIVELNMCFGGYRSEFIRMASFGTPPKKEREIFEAVYACYKETLALAKPGKTITEIVEAGHKVLEEKGFPADIYLPKTHANTGVLGHGIGLDMFELPVLGLGNKTILKPGMTFVLHPGLFGALCKSRWGALLGDTIVINDTNAKPIFETKWKIDDFASI